MNVEDILEIAIKVLASVRIDIGCFISTILNSNYKYAIYLNIWRR